MLHNAMAVTAQLPRLPLVRRLLSGIPGCWKTPGKRCGGTQCAPGAPAWQTCTCRWGSCVGSHGCIATCPADPPAIPPAVTAATCANACKPRMRRIASALDFCRGARHLIHSASNACPPSRCSAGTAAHLPGNRRAASLPSPAPVHRLQKWWQATLCPTLASCPC